MYSKMKLNLKTLGIIYCPHLICGGAKRKKLKYGEGTEPIMCFGL